MHSNRSVPWVVLLGIVGIAILVASLDWSGPDRPGPEVVAPRDRVPGADVSASAGPHGIVTGEVRVFETQAAAADVVVHCEGEWGSAIARTDARGLFRLSVPAGGATRIEVRPEAPFRPAIVTGLHVRPGETTRTGVLYVERAVPVAGRVVDDLGRPVPGAIVHVRRALDLRTQSGMLGLLPVLASERPPVESAPTGPDGRFTFLTLSPGTFSFEAHAEGFAVGFRTKVVVAPSLFPRPIRIVVGPGASLSGSIRTSTGQPVAGARVTVLCVREELVSRLELNPVQTVSDVEGRYEFESLTPGQSGLIVAAEGFPIGIGSEVNVGIEDRFDVVLGGTAAVEGVVRDGEGNPLEGVEVAVMLTSPSPAMAHARTGGDGRYRLDRLPGGPFLLLATGDGYTSYPPVSGFRKALGEYGETLPPDATLRRDITLSRGSVIFGKVTDARSGRPVVGAEVRAIGLATLQSLLGNGGTRTDAAGEYRCAGVGEGRHVVLALAKGYAIPDGLAAGVLVDSMESGQVEDEPAEGVVVVRGTGLEIRADLKLAPATRYSGRVLGPDGEPVAGARVSFAPDLGGLPTALANLPWFHRSTALTNEQGVFEIIGHDPEGPAALVAEREGLLTATSEPIEAALGETVANIELRLGAPGAVEGTVLDEAGEPVASALVRAARQKSSSWDTFQNVRSGSSTLTDRAGRFRIGGLPPGTVALRADAAGLVPTQFLDVEVSSDRTTSDIVLTLPRGLAIAGVVRDEQGRPMPGARVWIDTDGERDLLVSSHHANGTPTGKDGTFRFDRLAPGDYCVSVSADGTIDRRLETVAAGTEDLDIRLRPGRSISGRIEDETGAPVSGVAVHAQRSPEEMRHLAPSGQGLTDDDGRFEIEGLDEQRYRLKVRSAKHREATVEACGGDVGVLIVLKRRE